MSIAAMDHAVHEKEDYVTLLPLSQHPPATPSDSARVHKPIRECVVQKEKSSVEIPGTYLYVNVSSKRESSVEIPALGREAVDDDSCGAVLPR